MLLLVRGRGVLGGGGGGLIGLRGGGGGEGFFSLIYTDIKRHPSDVLTRLYANGKSSIICLQIRHLLSNNWL